MLLRVVTWIGAGLGGWDGGRCWFGVLLAEVMGKGSGMCRLGKGMVWIGVVRSLKRWGYDIAGGTVGWVIAGRMGWWCGVVWCGRWVLCNGRGKRFRGVGVRYGGPRWWGRSGVSCCRRCVGGTCCW